MQKQDDPEPIINTQDVKINTSPIEHQNNPKTLSESPKTASEAQKNSSTIYRKNSFSHGLGIYQIITYVVFCIDIALYVTNSFKFQVYNTNSVRKLTKKFQLFSNQNSPILTP